MLNLVGKPRGKRVRAHAVRQGLAFVLLASFVALMPVGAAAQTLTADQLQLLQQNRGSAASQPVTPHETILEPTAPSNPNLPMSKLEQILSMRAGIGLKQFGYDQLGVGRAVSLPQMGAVQDDYILGPGDEIVVSLRGQENSEYRATVDRDGRIVLPRINPISASGRTFGQFQKDLVNAVHKAYVTTEAFVSIGRVRQISVLVSGEVGSPGVRTLTGLSTPVDAILVSGGVKKSGSLRNLRIIRGGREISVDLYSVLVSGVRSKHLALADGDKIIVPPLGASVAIAGEARRPGIYELSAGQSAIRVRDALSLASGMSVPGKYVVSLLRTLPDGRRQLVDISNDNGMILHDGEIIFVKQATNVSLNQVTLVGAVRAPGVFAVGRYKTLHDVLPSTDVLAPGAYVLFGIVEHTDPLTLGRTAVAFSPLAVIQGKANLNLASDDVVHIFTRTDMRDIVEQLSRGKGEANTPNMEGNTGNSADLHDQGSLTQDALSADMKAAGVTARSSASPTRGMLPGSENANRTPTQTQTQTPTANEAGEGANWATGQTANGTRGEGANRNATPTSDGTDTSVGSTAVPMASAFSSKSVTATGKTDRYDMFSDPILSAEIAEYRVLVTGAVRDPGTYLVMPGTPASDLLVAAGGLTTNADLSSFELTSTTVDSLSGTSTTTRQTFPATAEVLNRLQMKSYDRLVFHSVYADRSGGTVTVSGEVRYPGTFDVLRTEKLSSILRRAGGFTEVAYPEGAVFQRISVAASERQESERVVNDLRSQLLIYLMKHQPNGGPSPSSDTIAALQSLILERAKTPSIGRVPVVADLHALETHPELDVLLEPGDSIVIPKVPSTVLVMGEVLRPGAQRFRQSGNSDAYVELAGGTTEQADTSRIIVVLPDGSVRSGGSSWLSFGSEGDIPAGSTVYVPRKLEISDFREILTDTIQIFSQLASTAAAMAVLSKQ